MELASIKQPRWEEITSKDIDLVVCASGYESRSSYLAGLIDPLQCRRVAFAFQEHKTAGARPKNDERFVELGFENIELSGSTTDEIEILFFKILKEINSKVCRIIIDISSMTRAWYGGIVRTLSTISGFDKIIVDFVYVPAKFPNVQLPYPPNEIVAPVKGFSGYGLANRPTSLVLGLGYDEGRAIGIKEALDPDLTVVFFSSPSTDKRYETRVSQSNNDILDVLDSNVLFGYPILDSFTTFNMLDSVCSGLLRDSRVVLASLGPKVFGLCCFLLSVKIPEISVWRVSAGTRNTVVDLKPSKYKVIIEIELSNKVLDGSDTKVA